MNEQEPRANDSDPTRASSPDAEADGIAPDEDPKAARRRKRARLTLRIPDDDVKRAAKTPHEEPAPDKQEDPGPITAIPVIPLGEWTGPEAEPVRPSPDPHAPAADDKTPLMPPAVETAPTSDEGIDVPVDEDVPLSDPEPVAPRDTEVALPPVMTGEQPVFEEAETTPALAPVRPSSQPPPPARISPEPAPRPSSQPPPRAETKSDPQALQYLSDQPRQRAQAILDEEEATPIESDRDSTLPLDADDVVSVEAVPGPPKMPANLSAPKATIPDVPRTPPKPPVRAPLVIVPSHATTPSPLAPQSVNESTASRKRGRPWWEEMFNDDFMRTMAKITDDQIAREVDFIEDSLGVAKGGALMDLACGTGRHAIELSRRGYQVVGYDLSLAMLARAADEAQDREQKLNFVHGDMREMTFEETFDGVYCWNTSFGFFEEEKNAQVIARVHRALRTGGQFLLDVVNRDFVIQQSPSLVWFEGDACICMDEMQVDFITSRMKVKRTMMLDDGRTREIDYSIRIYSLHELGKLLHDHGFRVAEVSGSTATPGVYFGATSPRTLILAEKR